MFDILQKITNYDRNRLIITLDMILSVAALIERLLINNRDELSEEEKLVKLDEIDRKYAEQRAMARE